MEKPYKRILITSASLSVFSLLLLWDNWVGENLWHTIFTYVTAGIVFTLINALVIGVCYYVISKKGSPYNIVLTFSVLLTLFLFAMDTLVWDVPANYSIKRFVFEWLVYGMVYTGIFFGFFSGISYALTSLAKLVKKSSQG